jgi:hypothetical protein
MHEIVIIISPDLAFTERADNRGKAIKFRNHIIRNGYEYEKPQGIVFYPPHRIERVDIAEIPEVKVIHKKKEEEKDA